ncbi:hypothetical protein Misp01_31200 [Microtetraspora sp. NBRC 13810]|nr:hypothetical protein Misp01_31200 [Microtetraspora sp. NBRC 13810]
MRRRRLSAGGTLVRRERPAHGTLTLRDHLSGHRTIPRNGGRHGGTRTLCDRPPGPGTVVGRDRGKGRSGFEVRRAVCRRAVDRGAVDRRAGTCRGSGRLSLA